MDPSESPPVAARRSRRGDALLIAACAPVLLLLVLPSLIIVPMALTRGQMIQFPPIWISIHAFTDYLHDPQWMRSTAVSFQVAALAVAVGGVTGSLAAIALHGRRFRGRGLLAGVILAPIVVPLVVLALGDYLLLAELHLIGGWATIGLVHGMLVTPYVFISVQTSLAAELDPAAHVHQHPVRAHAGDRRQRLAVPGPGAPCPDGSGARGATAARMSGAGRRVEVSGLWKRYGAGVYVVRDVNFDLQPGEFLTLLGPSGSGKSTTLLMVAGFETPSGGTIRVDGTDIAGRLPEHRNFGVVFQGYALFPHMTVQENVEFPLRMKRVPGADRRRRAAAMLEKVGLAEFAARRPRELSGGILFVTHDQDEAMMMSDRIAVMQEGRIVQMGSPPDVYLHPGTPFVAGFLGETNMLPGVMCGRDGPHGMVKFSGGTLGHARLPREGTPPGAGDSVVVALRPERIRLLAPSEPSEVAFDGVVCSHTFLGRSARYVVQLPGQAIVVSTPQWPPPAHVRDGAEVRLGWSREDAQILGTEDVDAGT